MGLLLGRFQRSHEKGDCRYGTKVISCHSGASALYQESYLKSDYSFLLEVIFYILLHTQGADSGSGTVVRMEEKDGLGQVRKESGSGNHQPGEDQTKVGCK